MTLRGKARIGEASASAEGTLLFDREVTLNITRTKAASSANQSSDLRQKMMKPTPYQIAAVITLRMVSRAAYPLADRPRVKSACSICTGSASGRLLHVTESTNTVCIC